MKIDLDKVVELFDQQHGVRAVVDEDAIGRLVVKVDSLYEFERVSVLMGYGWREGPSAVAETGPEFKIVPVEFGLDAEGFDTGPDVDEALVVSFAMGELESREIVEAQDLAPAPVRRFEVRVREEIVKKFYVEATDELAAFRLAQDEDLDVPVDWVDNSEVVLSVVAVEEGEYAEDGGGRVVAGGAGAELPGAGRGAGGVAGGADR